VSLASFLPGKLPFHQNTSAGGKTPAKASGRTTIRRPRFLYILAFFVAWTIVICARLLWLQVLTHHTYVEKAVRQQQRTFEVAPRRGILYDRNLHELAMTVLADSIYAVPYEITDSKDPAVIAQAKSDAANALAKVVHTDPEDSFTSAERIGARLIASRDFAWVARKLDPETVAKVRALNLKGVYVQKEFKRFYPDSKIAAQVLGYVGIDDNGLGGVEQNFDDDLHGTPGHLLTAVDAKRHVLGSQESEPMPGENLVLTLDENIQFMAEQALDHNMERTHAEYGTVVVQDPHTGQILALAVRPTFDPNDFRHATKDLLRNHAVSDVYEPGSTFKPVTYAAALEEKAITPDTIVDCGGGQINVAGHTVHDAPGDHFGLVPAWKALAVSSNVCAIRVGQRIGPERFYKYIRAFGFGERTDIELPAETRGLLEPLKHWGPASMGAIPMGQEIAVTPIQIVTMVSTIANGGVYVPPHILLKSTDLMQGDPKLKPAAFHPESSLPDPLPEGAHRVVSEMTAAQMRKMMEDVVLIGTAHGAVHLNGYSAAGKTGTAQKIDPRTRTYSKTKFVASFVGFAPVNNPAITIAIVMDSPDHSMHFGAQASAPVFQELAQQILEYLGVPHDIEVKSTANLTTVMAGSDSEEHVAETDESVEKLFAEVNDLPPDDPLRQPQQANNQPVAQAAEGKTAEPEAAGSMAAVNPTAPALAQANPAPPDSGPVPQLLVSPPPVRPTADGAVVVDSTKKVSVPSFVGQPVRRVVEQAGTSGLAVQVVGSGLAREQAPAPGTMVPTGTEVVVRFTR
jgi:cell division protein FtsI (penicillin-binding protein 3)